MTLPIPVQIGLFVLVGFCAQLIDGALGMAYGVSSNALLLSFGVPPATASANVHAAEVVTTAVSGISHHRLGNVDRRLFLMLLLPGVLGAAAGAYLLSSIDGNAIKPYLAIYLLVMGVVNVVKALRRPRADQDDNPIKRRTLIPLGLLGGFFDAIGGGGWGPIVTSTLVARGNHPRTTIGSVNAAEFFVTFVQVVVVKRVPVRPLMAMVGVVVIALDIRTLLLMAVEIRSDNL